MDNEHFANYNPVSNKNRELDGVPNLQNIEEPNTNFLLLQYSDVLKRSAEHGVRMEDLNTLQHDLEKLLSTCVVRKHFLLKFDLEDQDEEIIEKHEQECCEKPSSLNIPLRKYPLHGSLEKHHKFLIIKHNNVPSNFSSSNTQNSSAVPNNDDMANNFWSFSKPYFAPVAERDLAFIDKLIQESSEEIYLAELEEATRKMHTRCPRFHQHDVMFVPEMVGGTSEGLKEKLQDPPEKTQISKEIEECLRELESIKQNNINDLLKLRGRVSEQLYTQ